MDGPYSRMASCTMTGSPHQAFPILSLSAPEYRHPSIIIITTTTTIINNTRPPKKNHHKPYGLVWYGV